MSHRSECRAEKGSWSSPKEIILIWRVVPSAAERRCWDSRRAPARAIDAPTGHFCEPKMPKVWFYNVKSTFFDEPQICMLSKEKAHGADPRSSFWVGRRCDERLRDAVEAPRGHQEALLTLQGATFANPRTQKCDFTVWNIRFSLSTYLHVFSRAVVYSGRCATCFFYSH